MNITMSPFVRTEKFAGDHLDILNDTLPSKKLGVESFAQSAQKGFSVNDISQSNKPVTSGTHGRLTSDPLTAAEQGRTKLREVDYINLK